MSNLNIGRIMDIPPEQSEKTCKRSAVVKNNAGIHCRPTAVIVKEARRFGNEIIVHAPDGTPADPTSAIELLALGLDKGSEVEIEVHGDEAEACCARLVELFETEFDFPPREKNGDADDNLMA